MNLFLQGGRSDFLTKKGSKTIVSDLSGPEDRPPLSSQRPCQCWVHPAYSRASRGYSVLLWRIPVKVALSSQWKAIITPSSYRWLEFMALGSRNKISENREFIFRPWKTRASIFIGFFRINITINSTATYTPGIVMSQVLYITSPLKELGI